MDWDSLPKLKLTFEDIHRDWLERREARKIAHPIRFFFKETLWDNRKFRYFLRRIRDGVWWVKYRVQPRYRYHVMRTGLPPGWWDADTRLLYASFSILKNFMEREKPFEVFDIEGSPHKKDWDTIKSLYHWWTVERPAREAKDYESLEDEEAKYEEDNRQLHRLIEVRDHLWT